MLALGIASLLLTQSQAKPIPDIDWNNLPYQQQVKQMADGWRQKYHLPGVWVALIKDGKVVACVATGLKDLERGLPASTSDYLAVGSVSKPITGTMIGYFVNRGDITYDTTIREVFPELAAKYPSSPLLDAKLRMLLEHTSGLPAYPKGVKPVTGQAYRMAELEGALADERQLPPGAQYIYAYGANLAVAMVERRTKTVFEEWMTWDVAKSIGLLDAGKRIDLVSEPVRPYWIVSGAPTLNSVPLANKAFDAAGAFYLRLDDLSRFVLRTLYGFGWSQNVQFGLTHRTGSVKYCDTLASWHLDSYGQLFHQGSLNRGDFAVIRIQPKTGSAYVVYINAVAKKGSFDFVPAMEKEISNLTFN